MRKSLIDAINNEFMFKSLAPGGGIFLNISLLPEREKITVLREASKKNYFMKILEDFPQYCYDFRLVLPSASQIIKENSELYPIINLIYQLSGTLNGEEIPEKSRKGIHKLIKKVLEEYTIGQEKRFDQFYNSCYKLCCNQKYLEELIIYLKSEQIDLQTIGVFIFYVRKNNLYFFVDEYVKVKAFKD